MLGRMLHRSTARTAVGLHAGICAAAGLAVLLVWVTTGGYFWPAWVYLALAVPLALHAGVWWSLDRPTGAERGLAIHGVAGVVLCLTVVCVWWLAGAGTFFPVWVIALFSITIPVDALIVYRRRLFTREQQLTERVDELTRTRRGALDVQAAELRRIERDLHDGAQARLVALSMHLGRAEERLEDRPEVAELVRRARGEAAAAIGELRDLARGIAPPVLADRGLDRCRRGAGSARGDRGDGARDDRPRAPSGAGDRGRRVLRRRRGADQRGQARARRARDGGDLPGHGAADGGGQRRRARRRRPGRQRPDRAAAPRRGRRRHAQRDGHRRHRHTGARGAAMRVVIAEDNALLREGLVALLSDHGVEVVAQAEDAEGLLRVINGHKPDLAIVDVRMPPTFTDEGVRAAIEVRRRQPGTGILILSQYVEPAYTAELLAEGAEGVGYLLKERVGDVRAFMDALRRVAEGGTALDSEVVSTLLRARDPRGDDGELAALSPREREVLGLMAEGRTNAAIARQLVITSSAVEKHVSSIFAKLDLPASDDDHRRVLAVLAFLRSA